MILHEATVHQRVKYTGELTEDHHRYSHNSNQEIKENKTYETSPRTALVNVAVAAIFLNVSAITRTHDDIYQYRPQ